MRRLLITLAGCGLAACIAADDAPPAGISEPQSEAFATDLVWQFEDAAMDLRGASCPDGTDFLRPSALSLDVDPVDVGSEAELAEKLAGIRLIGAWHLTADDANFGGLSGLAVMRSGSLLAITDAGAWVSIGIDPETGAPDGLGSLGYMRGADGKLFASKRDGDAEGLTFREGLAFVSFEQDHRIEAFDLEGCGMAARAARVVDLPPVVLGQRVPDNRGAEALTLSPTGELHVGFEIATLQGSPAGQVRASGDLANVSRLYQPSFYLLTDMDYQAELMAHVFRAYDPIRGARIQVRVAPAAGGDALAVADLKPPLQVDNFEGIAFATGPEGETRLWLVADDNFNITQRTLLYAFELD